MKYFSTVRISVVATRFLTCIFYSFYFANMLQATKNTCISIIALTHTGKRVTCALCLLLLFSLGTCLSSPALATDLDVMDKQRKAPPEPKSQPKVHVTEEAGEPVFDASTRFTLGSMRVDNATVFSQEELLKPYSGLIGSVVSFEKIARISRELTSKYRDAGYLLSRVVIPAQEASTESAEIRLVAIEGYIAGVEYAGDPALVQQFKSYFSSVEKKLLSKRPLKHSDFERQMLLLQDIPGLKITSQFKEASVPGGSILLLQVDKKVASGSIGWGNTGTESAGPGQLSVSMGIATLPVIGAKTTLSYTQADVFDEYYSWQVGQSYQFANGLSLWGSYGQSSSPQPDTDFARLFDYSTKSQTFELGLSYPLIRSRDLNLSLGTSFNHRNSKADLLNARYTEDRLRNLGWVINFDMADEWGGVTQAITTFTHGINAFGATNHSLSSSSPLAGAEYCKVDLYLSRNQQLFYDISLLATAELQLSDSALSSYDQYSLGGSQFGRGYDPGVLSNDNAFAASLEPRWTYYITDSIALQPFSFIDWGSSWTSKKIDGDREKESLSSAGAGLRLWGNTGYAYVPDFSISGFVGKPLEKVPGANTSERYVLQFTMMF